MAIIRWEPVRELDHLQSEINRIFNGILSPASSAEVDTSSTSASTRRWVPAMDLHEEGDEYVITLDVPGLTQDDINVDWHDGTLTIHGERKWQNEERRSDYFRKERSWGAFSRSLTLPDTIDASAIEATVDSGVLEVRVPKPVESKPQRINVAVGGSAKKQPETITV